MNGIEEIQLLANFRPIFFGKSNITPKKHSVNPIAIYFWVLLGFDPIRSSSSFGSDSFRWTNDSNRIKYDIKFSLDFNSFAILVSSSKLSKNRIEAKLQSALPGTAPFKYWPISAFLNLFLFILAYHVLEKNSKNWGIPGIVFFFKIWLPS